MFTVEQSILLIIDVQGKLASLMYERDEVIKRIQAMIKAAKILGIPILWTEQLPEKIGNTIPEISNLLTDQKPIEKESFSCWPNKRFAEALSLLNRKQIIVVGIEAHVCVYQTVRDLIAQGFQVQVAGDAISSRTKENKEIGLEAIRHFNIQLTGVEMILTELMQTAAHPKFREILSLIK